MNGHYISLGESGVATTKGMYVKLVLGCCSHFNHTVLGAPAQPFREAPPSEGFFIGNSQGTNSATCALDIAVNTVLVGTQVANSHYLDDRTTRSCCCDLINSRRCS